MKSRPLLFLIPYYVTVYRYGSFKIVFKKLTTELILMLPLLYWHFQFLYSDIILALVYLSLGYLLANIILVSVYEIQYVINDIVVVKREDKPSIRSYPVRPLFVVISRGVYSLVAVCLMLISRFDVIRVFVAIVLLSLAFLLHNIQKYKLKRIYTFALIRLTRYLFIPLCLIDSHHYLLYVPIVFMPLLFVDIIQAYEYNLKKYSIEVPKMDYPWYYIYGIFLPIQLMLIDWKYIIGNIMIVLFSISRYIKRCLKRKLISKNAS